jgi:hypothetical protein
MDWRRGNLCLEMGDGGIEVRNPKAEVVQRWDVHLGPELHAQSVVLRRRRVRARKLVGGIHRHHLWRGVGF